MSKSAWRALAVLVAMCCLAIAAYLAFDWADYGFDSTCGNFIRYKGDGTPCSNIMRNRVLAVVGLVAFAIVLGVAAARPARHRGNR